MRAVQQRRWWLHDCRGVQDTVECDHVTLLLHQAQHVAGRLHCTFATVKFQIVSILLVLHGPKAMLMTDDTVKSVFHPDDGTPNRESPGKGIEDPIDALQGLHRNVSTLWKHVMT